MDSVSDTESDTDSHEHRSIRKTYNLKYSVFESYFQKIFSSNEFIKQMNQRCTPNGDVTSYILLCEAIKRNDTKNAISLLKYLYKGRSDSGKDIPLHLATLTGNTEIVEALLNKGARANVNFFDQKEPLHLICDRKSSPIPNEMSRIAIAKLLIKQGANINAVEGINKDTPLISAIQSKFFNLAKFLLNNGSDRHCLNKYSKSALHIAFLENAGTDLIELLYDNEFNLHQRDSNRCSIFSYAVRNLINSGFGTLSSLNKPLHSLQFLLKHGVSVNSTLDKHGNKILHIICQNNAAQIMKIFLDYGAEINVQNEDGKTALHFCAEHQPINFVELLLEHGADMNILTNNGMSVIHFAAANSDPKVLNLFISHGLNVDAKDKDENFTPLFNAVWSNRHENVKLLLESQANVNERIIHSQIALHVAIDQERAEIIKLLLEYGSDINTVDDCRNTPLTISLNQTELSSSESSDNESFDELKPESIKQILIKHVAKLFYLGQHLSDQNLRIINDSRFKTFFKDRVSELDLMNDTNIIEGVTFFNILTKSRSQLVSYMYNDNFVNSFFCENYAVKFPIYFEDIIFKLEMARRRFDLLESSTEIFIRIVQNIGKTWATIHLPSSIIDRILSYLNNKDLEILTSLYNVES